MKPLITKAQGRACRKAAEYIAAGEWDGDSFCDLPLGCSLIDAVDELGWCSSSEEVFDRSPDQTGYDQSEVLTALLWCAEIAGEA